MEPIVLYCKSYRNDVLRVRRLLDSARRHNVDQIPVFVSAPAADLPLFREQVGALGATLIRDEDIVGANPHLDVARLNAERGYLTQQVIKGEFWRLGLCANYLVLDSDAYFIRDFRQSDFLHAGDAPYTVMHEQHELLQYAATHGRPQIADNFRKDALAVMRKLGRQGRIYAFGPTPAIWSAKVWRALDEEFLLPQRLSFLDAILELPTELAWYGEALLKYRPIPLMPIEPLFKCYHYEGQYLLAQRDGETDATLKDVFLGVTVQSNWQKESDLEPRRAWWRVLRRSIKRLAGRY